MTHFSAAICQGHVTSFTRAFLSRAINSFIKGQMSLEKSSLDPWKRAGFSLAPLQRPCPPFPPFYTYSMGICYSETHCCHMVLHNYFPFRCHYRIASPSTLSRVISHVFASFDLGLRVVCHKSAAWGWVTKGHPNTAPTAIECSSSDTP